MSDPKKTDENIGDPFDGLPEEEIPIIDGIDGEDGIDGIDEEEVVASREYEDAVADAEKIISSNKKSPRKKKTLILACVGALLVGIIGWLGWSYWVDRDALATLTSDLMAARERAESSKGNPEESGETAAANQLSSRIRQIVDAPWWDQVVVRIVDEGQVVTAQEEASDLMESAKRRTENRAWWSEQVSSVEQALAVEDRTIPTIQGEFDDLHIAQPPHLTAGGFTDEMVNELSAKIQGDINNLTAIQDAMLALLQQKFHRVSISQTQDELLAANGHLESPLGTDRNPPEVADAIRKIAAELQIVTDLLAARDALQIEMTLTLNGIGNSDLETATRDSIKQTLESLQNATFPDDSRYDMARQLNSQSLEKASEILSVLEVRDAALEWITNQKTELAEIETLSDMAAFANKLSEGEPPQCELLVVNAATEEFVSLIRARVLALEEQQLLLEASIARQELCEKRLYDLDNSESFTSLLQDGHIANASAVLLAVEPESEDQIMAVQALKEDFSKSIALRFKQLSDDATTNGQWSKVADEFRNCFASQSMAIIAPRFAIDSDELWKAVVLGEDRMLYADLQQHSKDPYLQIVPAARWYLDPSRTRGMRIPMQVQVAALLDSLDVPSVSVQIEGIEWSSPECEWAEPVTLVSIDIGDSSHQFSLGQITQNETSLFGEEIQIKMPQDETIKIVVKGNFSCSNDDGVFSGTGKLTMDEFRTGGRFSLPFWNDADQSMAPHKLLLVSIPDEKILVASELPPWSESITPIDNQPDQPVEIDPIADPDVNVNPESQTGSVLQ